MDSPAVGGEDFEAMCKRDSRGEEKWKVKQQATANGFGRARRQKAEKSPSRDAKYDAHSNDSVCVEWQGYGSCPQTTPSLVYRCEALGGVGSFQQQNRWPERAIHFHINVQVHLGERQIGRRIYGNIQTRAYDQLPHIWPDFVQLLPFKSFQVETWR